jgi:hypothetical protein
VIKFAINYKINLQTRLSIIDKILKVDGMADQSRIPTPLAEVATTLREHSILAPRWESLTTESEKWKVTGGAIQVSVNAFKNLPLDVEGRLDVVARTLEAYEKYSCTMPDGVCDDLQALVLETLHVLAIDVGATGVGAIEHVTKLSHLLQQAQRLSPLSDLLDDHIANMGGIIARRAADSQSSKLFSLIDVIGKDGSIDHVALTAASHELGAQASFGHLDPSAQDKIRGVGMGILGAVHTAMKDVLTFPDPAVQKHHIGALTFGLQLANSGTIFRISKNLTSRFTSS